MSYWLLVIGYWLLVIDYWLLFIGYCLLVIGYWLLARRKLVGQSTPYLTAINIGRYTALYRYKSIRFT
ncbi:hypothetical protein QT970_30820 [Microcoleus sp. herbarium8]|uniref:hypothetical protein n=1 Tax=Microcoleus sp. herbarium8 TaxID=3055436 RepID=UPI002FD44467